MKELKFSLLPLPEGQSALESPWRFRCSECLSETILSHELGVHAGVVHGKNQFTVSTTARVSTGSGFGGQAHTTFRKELESLLNSHSMENWSNTPDFILAHFLVSCLKAFDKAVIRRDEWYLDGHKLEPGGLLAEGMREEIRRQSSGSG